MKQEQEVQLRSLLLENRILSLAVLHNGQPVVGLTPFALLPDFSGALVHVSRLSRHGRGMRDAVDVGILIHAGHRSGLSPFQISRLSLQASAERLGKGDPDYQEARGIYLERFPESSMMFQLGDFDLYRLRFRDGRFITGFASALNVEARTLQLLAAT